MTDIDDLLARCFAHLDEDIDPDEYAYADDPDDELPRAPLDLDPAQRTSLVQAIQAGLGERGCDTTLRLARAWARREKVRWSWLRGALEERGGYCDCEVLMNVLPPPD